MTYPAIHIFFEDSHNRDEKVRAIRAIDARKASVSLLTKALKNKATTKIAVGIATGESENIQDLLIASSKATLGVQLLTEVRNRAIESYQEIMRMQV